MATKKEIEVEFEKWWFGDENPLKELKIDMDCARVAFLAGRESAEKETNTLLWLIIDNMGGVAIIDDEEVAKFDPKNKTIRREYDEKNKCTRIYRQVIGEDK